MFEIKQDNNDNNDNNSNNKKTIDMKLKEIKKIRLVRLGIDDALVYDAEQFCRDCESRIKDASLSETEAIMYEARLILSRTKEYDTICIFTCEVEFGETLTAISKNIQINKQ